MYFQKANPPKNSINNRAPGEATLRAPCCLNFTLHPIRLGVLPQPAEHGFFHRPEDILIAGAPAQVARHQLADLVVGVLPARR